jgi:hypothetical protein
MNGPFLSPNNAIVLKGKDYQYWTKHSEFIQEHAKNFGSSATFIWKRPDYPGSDDDWELLHRILMKHTPSLFIVLGDRVHVNPKTGYTQKDLERILDYLMYVPHKDSLAHYIKHRGPKRTRRERRVMAMTPQAVVSRGRNKPRKSRTTKRSKSWRSSHTVRFLRKHKAPTIRVSQSNHTRKHKRVRHKVPPHK